MWIRINENILNFEVFEDIFISKDSNFDQWYVKGRYKNIYIPQWMDSLGTSETELKVCKTKDEALEFLIYLHGKLTKV